MAMLDRYRKTGGFVQLVSLLESSPPSKQEKFLALIREENAAWEEELKLRMLSFSRVLGWKAESLSDIWARIPEKVLAVAAWTLPTTEKEAFIASLSQAQKRKLEEHFSMNAPTEGEILSCQLKIVGEIRAMSQNGLLRLDKVDAGATIPEQVEERLNDPAGFSPTSPGLREMESAVASPTTGSSSAAVMLIEEMKELRKKLQAAASENQSLKGENQLLKDKLEQIRKIA